MTSGDREGVLTQDRGGPKRLVAIPREKRLAEDLKGWTVE